MRHLIYTLLFIFMGVMDSFGQKPIEVMAIKYQSYGGSTLSFLEMPEVSNQLLHSLDSFSRHFLQQPMVKSKQFKIYQEAIQDAGVKMKSPANDQKTTPTATFELTMTELPLNALLRVPDLDSGFIQLLLQKQTVGFLQMNAKLLAADGIVLLNKDLKIVLSRNKKTVVIGFISPDYLVSPKSFSKLLDACLPILLDSKNESEIIQMTTVPAILADNFIQPNIKTASKLPTNINQGIIQYNWKQQLQYLRYQAPSYETIVMRGKKQTLIPKSLEQSIFDNQFRDPIFLREECRDILGDKNYLIQCVVTIETNPFANEGTYLNKKTGLPFRFLPSNDHIMKQDKDTIALFSVTTNKTDPNKQRFFHQLYSAIDSNSVTVSAKIKAEDHVYNYEMKGILKEQPFQIFYSGMHGAVETIREVFYKDQLVCIVQGREYPELIAVLDDSIDLITLNQLLLLAFSSLF